MTRRNRPKEVGLALSGGAVLGTAHIGVLQALDDAGVRVTHLTGSSMGALVAAFYAFGLSGKEIESIAEALRWPDVTRFSPSKLGLLSQKKLRDTFRKHLGDVRIEDAGIRLALVATDIANGERVVMTDGDLATAACASACFPGVFLPVERDGRLLVDGGLVESLPLSPLRRWGVETIVAVDVYMGRTLHRPRNLMELLGNTADIILANMSRHEAVAADLLITPDLQGFSRTDLKDTPLLIRQGYAAAAEALEDLRL